MKIIEGKYGAAKIFSNDVEELAITQVKTICDNEVSSGSMIRMMPDIHPGKIGPIGLSMTIGKRVIPQLLGVDIGCGMLCARLKKPKSIEFQKLDKVIRESSNHKQYGFYYQFHCRKKIDEDNENSKLGTIGGGNHFIELDVDEEGIYYLIIHTGSRHLGQVVSDYYTDIAYNNLQSQGIDESYYMSYLEGEDLKHYLDDVNTCQEYARWNRGCVLNTILDDMKWKIDDSFDIVHNYIDIESQILHKGSISAKKGEQVLIPVNMRDGVILGTGKGNKDWNCSAPHGSGRKISRSEVKNVYTVSSFKKDMEGVYSSCINSSTLDEAPIAYRSLDEIISQIEDAVEVTNTLKPVYNFKHGR